jgi:translocation and assembly module TamA
MSASTIRGYGYQLAGPLQDDKPVGGKSMLAASCEYRLRVRERIDLIAFVDAGNAYSKEVPDTGDLKFGSGLGVGYYSKIGPIRLDVAFPLERRSGIDDAFQVYVNLGQSF